MSVKVKGGMYCPACKREVLAQKTSHAVRNSAVAATAIPTAGMSLVASKAERWRCPECGGPAQSARSAAIARKIRENAEKGQRA